MLAELETTQLSISRHDRPEITGYSEPGTRTGLRKALLRVAVLGLLTAATQVNGQETNNGGAPGVFSAELRIGAEYDSNVSVDELDVSSGRSDYAAIADLRIEYEKEYANKTELSLSYDYSNTFYDDFDQLNRQTHMLAADIGRSAESFDYGATYHYIDSRLDGDDFLNAHRFSPYVSGFLSRRWFSRLAYVYNDKELIDRPARDAQTRSGEIDLYYFRRGLRSYFNIGYRYKDEDADGEAFEYSSHSSKLRYIHRFEINDRLAKLELAWRFEDRDYRSRSSSFGEKRDDDRHRWQLNVEFPMLKNSAFSVYYTYSDYDSNQPVADYNQHVAGLAFVTRW